jgi:metal-responsive CopG/Arc/MetJ family transcriptional regulator
MRRALVGIPEKELKALDTLSEVQHVSRAELIRRAVSLYLEKFKPADKSEEAFGLWEDRKVDGLAYQTRLREEW